MRFLSNVRNWFTNLFPDFVWETLSPCEALGHGLDCQSRWEALYVRWADGSQFVLTYRRKTRYA
jgi:hypothetical protein